MVAALRRGVMLLISAASPPSSSPLLVRCSPALPFSCLCRHSSSRQQLLRHSFGSVAGRRTAPSSATQQSSLWPIFGINGWAVISRRAFQEGEGLAGFNEGFRPEHIRAAAEKRLWWKRTPAFGISGFNEGFRADYRRADAEKRLWWKRIPAFGVSDPPRWRERNPRPQRNRRESVGGGHGNIWEADRGGGGKMFSRALSNSTGDAAIAANAQRRGDGPNKVKDTRERENGDQRRPWSSQGVENWKGSASNGSFAQLDANGGSSQVNERPASPPSKLRANYYEKFAQSSGEGGDGRSSGGSWRSPSKPKPNDHEKFAQFNGGGDGRSSQQSGRPSFRPKSNYYDKLAQSRKGEGENGSTQGRGSQNPFKAKANYYDNLGSPSFSKRKTAYSDNVGQPAQEGRNNRPVKFSRDQNAENAQPRNDSSGDGPHYGYKLREGGTELGKFRRIGGPRNRVSGGGDSQRKRVPFRESGALGRQTFPDSSSGRNLLNSKQLSPEEEKEAVVRKYPPRRLEGEKKWQYAVRKKQLGLAGHTRGSKRKVTPQWVDHENLGNEPQGDDWRRKKTAWLCKEIPPLRPRPIVTILNEQRKWIKAEDTKYVIEHLLQIDQTLRAHRVLKWEMQQPWYEFDYDLMSKVAVQLGQNNKLSRTRDIYDLIITNGKVPNLATYEVLINCYIVDGEKPALAQAWSLFNQMSQLGGHEPPPTLSYNLFQRLIQKGEAFLDQADELFKRIKMAGLPCGTEMCSLLIHAHGTKGNKDRVDDLIKEMNETGLPVGQDVYAAILRSCAKDGNVAVGEQAFADLKLNGHKPIPSVYSSLIKMYGKAGLHDKAFQTFEDMRETKTRPNLIVYEPMIEVAVMSGNIDQAEKLLKEAHEGGTPSLHACYNSIMEFYSKNGLSDESERLFNEMECKGYPPNQASFNVLLEAYVRHHLVEKADAVYENMKRSEKVKPNKKTYELMIKLYGEAKSSDKVKELFRELADKKLDVAEEANRYLEASVNPKQLAAHRNAQLKLEREEREILAGVLLAGAGVETHDRNRTYELHFGLDPDSEVGLALINSLYKQFSAWSTEPPNRQPLPDPKNPKRSKMLLAFQTVSHGSFRFFAHQYRPNHSPAIPRLIHRWLTPRALAYWYMYGGTKCPETGGILLNASVYRDKDIMLVVNALKTRTIDCEKKKTSIGMAICFNGRSAMWLWGLMEPHILHEVKGLLKPEDDLIGEDLVQQV